MSTTSLFLRRSFTPRAASVLFMALACCTSDPEGDRDVAPAPHAGNGGDTAGAGGSGGSFNNPDGGITPTIDSGMAPVCPTTCTPEGGQYCGTVRGCSGKLECGECSVEGFTCGGRGSLNVCGAPLDSGFCTPTMCDHPTGEYCDIVNDGCGGPLDCGGCSGTFTCGGGGTPRLCGAMPGSGACTDVTCTPTGGKYCGVVGNGCGGELDCGGCDAPQACGARVTSLCGVSCALCAEIPTCSGGGTTTISGKAFSPALMNADPLYNALVYIPNVERGTKLPALADGPSCDRCKPLTADDAVAAAITGPDGTFTLRDVPAGDDIPVVLQLGPWRMQTTIDVMPCQDNALPDGTLRLPRNQDEGDIPLTAIVTGNVDKMQCLLRKIGIEDSEFTNPDGTGRMRFFVSNGARIDANTPLADALTGTTAGGGAWSTYTQVLLPCEGGEALKTAAALGNFLDYVNRGGRAFATHFSYTWLFNNGPFATSATWAPDPFTLNLPPDPLTATIDTSTPKGADFASWLELAGALSSAMPPQIQIAQPRHDLDAVPAMGGGQRWVFSDSPATVQHYTVDTPVGAAPEMVCGRVIYSDFHVLNDMTMDETFPAECDESLSLSPQEKLLEFMLFDLASCIGMAPPPPPPSPPPPVPLVGSFVPARPALPASLGEETAPSHATRYKLNAT